MGSIKKNRVGEKLITKQGYEIEIIEYINAKNMKIVFNDLYGAIIEKIAYSKLVKGEVTNPYHRTCRGVGYLGQGIYLVSIKGKDTKCYKKWSGLMERSYSDNYKKLKPTYKDVTVCEEWHCFQNFAEWYFENNIADYQLDKDILIKGNKVYSPETCCFVPQEINCLFTKNNSIRGEYPIGVSSQQKDKYEANLCIYGKQKYLGLFSTVEEAFNVYKLEKEKQIKEVAEQWRGKITTNVYEALINYKVDITD